MNAGRTSSVSKVRSCSRCGSASPRRTSEACSIKLARPPRASCSSTRWILLPKRDPDHQAAAKRVSDVEKERDLLEVRAESAERELNAVSVVLADAKEQAGLYRNLVGVASAQSVDCHRVGAPPDRVGPRSASGALTSATTCRRLPSPTSKRSTCRTPTTRCCSTASGRRRGTRSSPKRSCP